MSAAKDAARLLFAFQRGCLLITHNRTDFRLLHDAWLIWTASWGVNLWHGGGISAERAPAENLALEILEALSAQPSAASDRAAGMRDHGPGAVTRSWLSFT